MVNAPRRLDALLVDRHAALVVLSSAATTPRFESARARCPSFCKRPRERRALLPPVARALAVAAAVLDAPEQDQQPIALVLVDLARKQRERAPRRARRRPRARPAAIRASRASSAPGRARRRDLRAARPQASPRARHDPRRGSRARARSAPLRRRACSELGQRGFGRERERGPVVVVLALERRVRLVHRLGRVAGDELLAQLEKVLGVATPHLVGLAALDSRSSAYSRIVRSIRWRRRPPSGGRGSPSTSPASCRRVLAAHGLARPRG